MVKNYVSYETGQLIVQPRVKLPPCPGNKVIEQVSHLDELGLTIQIEVAAANAKPF